MQALPKERRQAGAHGCLTAVAHLLLAVSLSTASAAHVHSLQGGTVVSRAVPRHMLGHPRRLQCQRSRRSVCDQLVYLRVKGTSRCARAIDVHCSVPCPNTEREIYRPGAAETWRSVDGRGLSFGAVPSCSFSICAKSNGYLTLASKSCPRTHCTLTCCLCGQLLYPRCARGPRRFAHHR